MLAVLPVVCLLLLWVAMTQLGVGRGQDENGRWLPALLAAAGVWAAFLGLSSEVLSLLHGLAKVGLLLVWSLATLACAGIAWRVGGGDLLRKCWQHKHMPNWTRSWWWGLVLMGALLLGLLAIAWIAPPNTTDSLQYHMPRVDQWQQDASLGHFPTAYYPELGNGIWAEETILQLKVLVGSDRASNLVQWLAMVGSILAAVATVRLFDKKRVSAAVTAAFIFSLPIGILESTSTQTDYVVALWMAVFVYFVVLDRKRGLSALEWIAAGSALGIGLLAKGTAYLVAFPFALWLIWIELSRGPTGQALKNGLLAGSIVAVTNLGYWWRNISTFGTPFGPVTWVADRVSFSFDPRGIPIGLLRQILLNFATPWEAINRSIVSVEHALERLLTGSPSPFRLVWAWNNEDLAGNPIHVVIALIAMFLIIWLVRRKRAEMWRAPILPYTLASLTSCVLFSWFTGFQVYGIRFQISLFVLLAPLVGVALSELLAYRWAMVSMFLLLMFSLPWVLLNQTRPLLGWRPRTKVDSVLSEPRQVLLFANWPKLRQPYEAAAAAVKQTSCKQVGLVVDSHDPEYLLWVSLGAPENGMRLEVLDPLHLSARFADPTFHPCAVVCTICGADRLEWAGLRLAATFGSTRVYANPG